MREAEEQVVSGTPWRARGVSCFVLKNNNLYTTSTNEQINLTSAESYKK